MRGIFNHLRRRRARLERDLDRELAYHFERRVDELVANGMSEANARRRANLEIGGLAQVREAVRETWTWPTLDALTLDLRYAVRSLAKSRSFALGIGAVLTLALGANIAVFSVVNAVLLEPLPYPNADRIVSIETLWTNTGQVSPDVSGPDYLDWEAQSDVFERMTATFGYDDSPVIVGDRAVFANHRFVSAGFFTVFGQTPAAGRLLTERDIPAGVDTDGDGRIDSGTAPVAVVAYDWATAHFGSAQGAVGKKIADNLEIVGVAAPGFGYPGGADIWMPWRTEVGGDDRGDHNYQAVGRLKSHVPLSRAQAQIRTIATAIAEQYPENRLKSTILIPLQERLTGPVRGALWLLMAASGVVLLIACTNVAGLFLARAADRAREIAVRAALGAGRVRVARQLLMEGGLLAVVSGAAGLLLAWLLTRLLLALSPLALSASESILDAKVLLFGLGVALLALLSFGVVPALRASQLDLMNGLRGGSKLVTAIAGTRLRSTLVIAEVALSVVLLVTGGLLARSFLHLQQVDLGFATDRVAFAYMEYPVYEGELERQRREIRERTAFYVELLERLRNVPGVSAAAGITFLPMGGGEARPARDMFVQGRPSGQPGERPQAEFYAITPDYFATLEIPLRAGRDFASTDTREAPAVAIVNDAFVRTILGGAPALGQHVRWNENAPWMEIVGVVADTRWQNPVLPAPPTLFVSSLTGIGTSLSIVARTSLDAQTLAGTLGSLIREKNPNVPVRVETLNERFEPELARPRFLALVVGVFSGLATLLAAVGLFSVLALAVGQRRRELAVRQALGAEATDVVALIAVDGARLVAVGLVLGLVLTVAVMRFLQGLLYEISPWDPVTYAGAAALLGIAGVIATLVPALRAAAIAPTAALQEE
jgi:putative ABC transport system permease protein